VLIAKGIPDLLLKALKCVKFIFHGAVAQLGEQDTLKPSGRIFITH